MPKHLLSILLCLMLHVNSASYTDRSNECCIGGVDSMTVVPFDKTYETPDEFSERLALTSNFAERRISFW